MAWVLQPSNSATNRSISSCAVAFCEESCRTARSAPVEKEGVAQRESDFHNDDDHLQHHKRRLIEVPFIPITVFLNSVEEAPKPLKKGQTLLIGRANRYSDRTAATKRHPIYFTKGVALVSLPKMQGDGVHSERKQGAETSSKAHR